MFCKRIVLSILVISNVLWFDTYGQNNNSLNFCGELIPLEQSVVRHKLLKVMNSNKKSIDIVRLTKKANYYFPFISYQLAKYGIPDDFKYLPIIESGFSNATSVAGAHGFWQIMPGTAQDLGLKIRSNIDERNNVVKSTIAACKHIKSLYSQLGSWTLVACAYNFGLGNVRKTIKAQRKSDYYQMRLNSETALYLYRIIAIKDLFLNPQNYKANSLTEIDLKKEIIEASLDNEEINQVTIQVKAKDTRFLDYIDRIEPMSANIFLELTNKETGTYGIALNDCNLYGFIVKKGTEIKIVISKGGERISASIESIPDLVLVDLSGKTSIEAEYFKPGLVLKVMDKE